MSSSETVRGCAVCPECKVDLAVVDEHDEGCSVGAGDHCDHHSPTDDEYDDYDYGADYCVHCECCCTCLGCEYGPRDGMLMFPDRAAAEVAP